MKFNFLSSLSLALAPLIGLMLYFFTDPSGSGWIAILMAIPLMGSVMTAVHHAEVIAHRIGEPYGTLVLALAVTIIEVSLIVSLMLTGGEGTDTLARDTVFAAVMIILTGIIGICLLVGGLRYREQVFGRHGVSSALVTLMAITGLTLVLPNFTTSEPGPLYNKAQLIFVAIVTLVLYGTFVLVQAVRHRDYFLPANAADEEIHAEPPTKKAAWISTFLLVFCLAVVVLLAKTLSPSIEQAVVQLGAPKSLVGIIVALVILFPESIAAVRAAQKNRLQTSLNLALGSALASIGLTIPAVAAVSVLFGLEVTLGIDRKSMMLLFLSLLTILLSFGTGRTTILQGVVLLVVFAVYLFTTVVP